MQTWLTTKIPKKSPESIVLKYLEKCRYTTQIASCSHMDNAQLEVPKVSAENCQNDESWRIYFERKDMVLIVG